jgi:hypothetical protein
MAFVLPFSMLLLVPVGLYNLNWFFPALRVLLGAHYLPFATLYGMRMFLFLVSDRCDTIDGAGMDAEANDP